MPRAITPLAMDRTEMVQVRKRQGRSMETRAKIVAAATEEFAERGFDGATTRSIAERAKTRHALVIYHFETKLNMWQVVMSEVVAFYSDAFKERLGSLENMDPITKLQRIQAEFIRMAAAHPELHWLMSHEAGPGGERLEWLLENLIGDNFETFKHLIEECQKAGRYVQGDAYHLHYLFLGAAARIFMLAAEVQHVMGRSPFEPDVLERHIHLCQQLFFRDAPKTRARPRKSAEVSNTPAPKGPKPTEPRASRKAK